MHHVVVAKSVGENKIAHKQCFGIVDDHKKTSVEGIYAIGDLVPGSQLAITSAADGAIAAIAINKSLLPPSRLV